MLITKKIQIDFADPRIDAIDVIQDIRKAAEKAGLNLFSRYEVRLQYPMPINGKVVVEIGIPSIIAEDFAIGNHLRGISSYLLKECGGKYDKYLVGKRLLNYTEIPLIDNNEDIKSNLPMIDKLEAIVSFTQLLERQDDEALNQIMRILDILNEGRN